MSLSGTLYCLTSILFSLVTFLPQPGISSPVLPTAPPECKAGQAGSNQHRLTDWSSQNTPIFLCEEEGGLPGSAGGHTTCHHLSVTVLAEQAASCPVTKSANSATRGTGDQARLGSIRSTGKANRGDKQPKTQYPSKLKGNANSTLENEDCFCEVH